MSPRVVVSSFALVALFGGAAAASAATPTAVPKTAVPKGAQVPAVCLALGGGAQAGYCPHGAKPTTLPGTTAPSACVALPLSIGGKPAHAGYCP